MTAHDPSKAPSLGADLAHMLDVHHKKLESKQD